MQVLQTGGLTRTFLDLLLGAFIAVWEFRVEKEKKKIRK